ncbi:MAG TPA: hypothetical protein VKU39_18885, partial [Streptosporangiaceae bacterium]|nr:hypothetical protein [Streptosporangiaceae bacterium]
MSGFGDELARIMDARGTGVRELARMVPCNPGHISSLRSGRARPSPSLAAILDDRLAAGGALERAARSQVPRARRGTGTPSRAIEALRVVMSGGSDGLGVAADGLNGLVDHYAHALAVTPSSALYGEMVNARSFAGKLLDDGQPRRRSEMIVIAGWLSSLLAISAADLGDHGAAVVWCTDTERRASDSGHPELAGWAALTRALIAWYQGDPVRSAHLARQGQAATRPGTAAYAKLAAQEMRSLAALGDAAGTVTARRRAAAAMSRLALDAAASGVYAVVRDDDPPYTATSLLLAGRSAEAAVVTRRILRTVYSRKQGAGGSQPTNYARTLLILALSAVNLGEADEAAAVGTEALDCGRIVWPTMVLAGRLASALDEHAPGS